MLDWPALFVPFPSTLNVHVASFQRASIRWAAGFGLFRDRRAREKFDMARFAWLVARCFHVGRRDALQLITDLTTWIFVEDDDCDETAIGHDPERLRSQYARYRAYLHGDLPLARFPLDLAFHELAGRLARAAPDMAWYARFAHTLGDYFDSSLWEAENRSNTVQPAVEQYIGMRRVTGGLPIYIDLVELALGEALPLSVRRDPRVAELMLITNDVTCWHNDIFSFAKELEAGDVHNLVVCLMRQHELDAEAAMREAALRCDAAVERFCVIVEELLFAAGKGRGATLLDRYVAGLGAIIQGNVDWSYESARYRSSSQLRESQVVALAADQERCARM